MNILVLAAGHADFETHEGDYPLCLAELDGVPLLERIVESLAPLGAQRLRFALRQDEVARFHLADVVQQLAAHGEVAAVPENTRGSACTALFAASTLPAPEELLIVSANELVEEPLAPVLEGFRRRQLDAGTLVFRSIHPRYSFVRLGESGLVEEVAQQRPISSKATAGLFWYASTERFLRGVENLIRKDDHLQGRYYMAKVLNEVILEQGRVGVHEIDLRHYRPLKSERQLLQEGVTP